MAATYFIDDAGDNSDGSTWAKAFSSMYAMLNHGVNPHGTAGAPLASGDLVYLGNDTVDAASYTANATIVGPTSGLPAILISSTVGAGSAVSYSNSSTRQIDASNNGANTYTLTFDGSFALYGVYARSGGALSFGGADLNESCFSRDCTLVPGHNATVNLSAGGNQGAATHHNITVNCTADTGSNAAGIVNLGSSYSSCYVDGITFSNVSNRTGYAVSASSVSGWVVNGDFSAIPTACEIVQYGGLGSFYIANCLMAASWVPETTDRGNGNSCHFANCGTADTPTYSYFFNYFGKSASDATIYRVGGATVEGEASSWLITTTTACSENAPFYTPWIYGVVAATGSRTFTLYVTNDTGDFDNSQAWLEIEYLSTSDEAIGALQTDQRDNSTGAFISITEAVDAQADDSTSVWVGLNDAGQGHADYMQVLTVTATVNETGQFRGRVAFAVNNMASSRYCYVDPEITVT